MKQMKFNIFFYPQSNDRKRESQILKDKERKR